MKTAIVVPGVTDLNKGDQALVWESHRLAQDTGLFSKVYILSLGDNKEEYQQLCGQSIERGYELLENILKHPRRGKHHNTESINESTGSLLTQSKNAVSDLFSRSLLVAVAPYPGLVKMFFNRQTAETVKQFRNCDSVFVKGGGFIHAYGERTAPYLMWFFLFYVRLALRLKKKVVFLPNSYGPFEGVGVKGQIKKAFGKMDLIFARESISKNKLQDLIQREVILSPDLGFYLKEDEISAGAAILKRYDLDPVRDKIVGITIRPWRFPGKSNPQELYEKYIRSVKELVVSLRDKGYKVAFFNQSLGPNAHEDDRNAIKEMSALIDGKQVVWVNENFNCTTLKAIYSNLHSFIGTRFHSVIFSMMSGIPSLAIAYGGNKAMGIMAEFGLNEMVVPIDDVTPEALNGMFVNLESRHTEVKGILAVKREEILQKRKDTIGLIVNKIG